MHVLVYVRRSKAFDESVLGFANKQLKAERITTVSEYFNGNHRIDMNAKEWDSSAEVQSYIDEHLDLSSIIFRDRVLRNTSFKECCLLIRRATGNILSLFNNNHFDALVLYPVDNYLMDIMVQIAKKRDIDCFGVSNFFMAGYKRITVYGEHNHLREPGETEVELAVEKIRSNFRSHMAPKKGKALRAALLRYFKYKARYPLFYLLGAKVLGRKEYDCLATPYNTTVRKLSGFFVERFFTSVDKIDFNKDSILVPLHYFPEATIEYWDSDARKVEFEDMLLCKIDDLSNRYEQIILKEHPATVFDNPAAFYKKLLMNPKVVLVDPFVATTELLKSISVVGCWTGTTGVEALVNGKEVEFFSASQYYLDAMNMAPSNVDRDGLKVNVVEPKVLMKEILAGCIKVDD